MATDKAAQLRKAMRDRRLMRFTRRFGKWKAHGYIQAVGPQFFLLAEIGDGGRLNGHECFRIADVKTLEHDPYAAFAEAALKKRGLKLGRAPRIDVSGIETIIRSAGKASPLVTIHVERIDPDVCYIGNVRDVDDRRLLLQEIGPGASWDHECTPYLLRHITRVGIGGEYEEALHLVGGPPPRLRNS